MELIALENAEIKYSTVQNWFAGDAEGKGGIYVRVDQYRGWIEARLADPASYTDGQDIAALQRRLAELRKLTEVAEARWLETEAEIERLSAA